MELLAGILLVGSLFTLAITWDFFTKRAKGKDDLPIVVIGFLFTIFLMILAFGLNGLAF